jgi:hypothetical protein
VPRRLDKSVNTLTVKRALLALVALWHRMPLTPETWFNKIVRKLGLSFATEPTTFKEDVDGFMMEFDAGSSNPRQHSGIFEGSALSGVILTADQGFDWDSLPAGAGEVTHRCQRCPCSCVNARQSQPGWQQMVEHTGLSSRCNRVTHL